MNLRNAISAWSAVHGEGLSASTRDDIDSIAAAVGGADVGNVACTAVDDSVRDRVVDAAAGQTALSEAAINQFLTIVIDWGIEQSADADLDDLAEAPAWADDPPQDPTPEASDEADLQVDAAADADLDVDTASDTDDVADLEAPLDASADPDEAADPDADPDEAADPGAEADTDAELDDTEDAELDDTEDAELDDTEDAELDDTEDAELDDSELDVDDAIFADEDDDPSTDDPSDDDPNDDSPEESGASSFFQTIGRTGTATAAAGAASVVGVDASPESSTPVGQGTSSVFTQAAEASSQRSIDWVTAAWFALAFICFAFVIYLYIVS